MPNLIERIYLDSELGVSTEFDAAGTTLENPYVYDSAARDLKAMAGRGLVRIMNEQVRCSPAGALIEKISFERLR